MNDLDEFTQYHAELLDGRYDCMDRLVLNAYFPVGMTGRRPAQLVAIAARG